MNTLSGTVSRSRHSTETSGVIGNQGRGGQINTAHVVTFRVDERPATIKLPGAMSLDDGDVVTLAGKEKAGTFVGYALRNDTSGAIYAVPSWPMYVGGGAALALGIPFSLILIGIPFLAVGGYAIYVGYRNTSARSLLGRTPGPAVAARA